jgi:hypothetical protein
MYIKYLIIHVFLYILKWKDNYLLQDKLIVLIFLEKAMLLPLNLSKHFIFRFDFA